METLELKMANRIYADEETAVQDNPVSHNRAFVWKVVLLSISSSFLSGFCISGLNTSIATVTLDLKWCDSISVESVCSTARRNQTIATSALFLSAFFGSMIGGRLTNYGRRFALLCILALFSVSLIISAGSFDIISLTVGRFLSGLSVGMNGVVITMFISEISPKSVRGFFVSLQQLAVVTGLFLSLIAGLVFGPTTTYTSSTLPLLDRIWWRVMFGIGVPPALFAVIIFVFVYNFETPHYYVIKGQFDEARRVLGRIYNQYDVPCVLKEITEAIEISKAKAKNNVGFFKALFISADHRMAIFVGMMIMLAVQLGGVNAFVSNSTSIFNRSGLNIQTATTISTVMGAVNIATTFPVFFYIDSWGRRPLLLLGTFLQTVTIVPVAIVYLFFESFAYRWLVVVIGIIGYMIAFSFALGPIPYVYTGEIFAAEIKESAMGACFAANWASGFLVVVVQRILTDTQGFVIFAVMNFLFFLFMYLFVLETSGRSIDQSPFYAND